MIFISAHILKETIMTDRPFASRNAEKLDLSVNELNWSALYLFIKLEEQEYDTYIR